MRRHPPTLSITFLVFSCVPAVLKLLAKEIFRLTFIVGTLKRWTTDDKRIAASGCAKSTLGSSHSLIVANFASDVLNYARVILWTKQMKNVWHHRTDATCATNADWAQPDHTATVEFGSEGENCWILRCICPPVNRFLFGLSSILPHDPLSSIHYLLLDVRAHACTRELV